MEEFFCFSWKLKESTSFCLKADMTKVCFVVVVVNHCLNISDIKPRKVNRAWLHWLNVWNKILFFRVFKKNFIVFLFTFHHKTLFLYSSWTLHRLTVSYPKMMAMLKNKNKFIHWTSIIEAGNGRIKKDSLNLAQKKKPKLCRFPKGDERTN